jgi:hypothetical protein
MTGPRKRRADLHLARPVEQPPGPSFSMLKKAIKLYRGRGVPKSIYRANAIKWLRAMESLGDKHALHRSKPAARWGVPGNPFVPQLRTPRRLGEQA